MPRFFFHTADGSRCQDTDGTELPDMKTARCEAIKFLGQVVQDNPAVLDEGDDFKVEVSDSGGVLLFVITAFSTDAPAGQPSRFHG